MDPGQCTGFAVIEGDKVIKSGVIDTGKVTSYEGLQHIYEGIVKVLDETAPDVLVCESLFYHKNIKSLVKLAETKAVICLAAIQHGIRVVEYAPREIKLAITGNGNASKQQVRYMVEQILGIEVDNVHVADALASAICHRERIAHNVGLREG